MRKTIHTMAAVLVTLIWCTTAEHILPHLRATIVGAELLGKYYTRPWVWAI